jgi:hypothetical protein
MAIACPCLNHHPEISAPATNALAPARDNYNLISGFFQYPMLYQDQ